MGAAAAACGVVDGKRCSYALVSISYFSIVFEYYIPCILHCRLLSCYEHHPSQLRMLLCWPFSQSPNFLLLGSRIKCGFDIRHFLVYFISVLGDSRFHYEPFNIAHWCRLAFFLRFSLYRENEFLSEMISSFGFSFYVNQFHFFSTDGKIRYGQERGRKGREKGETDNVKKGVKDRLLQRGNRKGEI